MRVRLPLNALALSTLTAALLALTPACAGAGAGEGEGEGEGSGGGDEPDGDGICAAAASGVSVAQVQDTSCDGGVADGGAVQLVGVTATSQRYVVDYDPAANPEDPDVPHIYGIYVSDDPATDRSGVLVTWYADAAGMPETVAIGDLIDVTGTKKEFKISSPYTETRVEATAVTVSGAGTPVAPVVIDATDLASATTGEDWEGVLVTINNVAVTELGQFGEFTVTGGAIIDDAIFGYEALAGETFISITGVVGYNIFTQGGFRILPRSGDDVVSDERPTNTVTELNDGTVRRCAYNEYDCAVALEDAVVTSPTIYLSTDDTRGPKYGFWIADSTNVDGDGRLQPYSGLFVTVSPETTVASEAVTTTYSFEQDQDRNFLAGAAPEPGDVVEIVGQNAENFDQSELRFVSILNKVTDAATDTSYAVLPALFVGEEAAALKGGRPAVDGQDFGDAEDVAPAANLEQWEGVLVELQDVETTKACYGSPFPASSPTFLRDFGYFLVTGSVEIGDAFFLDQAFGGFFDSTTIDTADRTCENLANKCEDSRELGQQFDSLIGIVNYSFDVYRVNPRSAADIAPSNLFVAPGTGGGCPQ